MKSPLKWFLRIFAICCSSSVFAYVVSSDNEANLSPSIWLESKEIDLGVIPPEQNTIVGAIHFMNEGAQPLEIRKVSGPCACFAGWSYCVDRNGVHN
jgi:hypothetical protein